jgi:hypothetical protein
MGTLNNRAGWAAAMALAVGVTSGASAADLGGNCCADLEERVAELEATTARKGNRKVSLEVSGWLNKTMLFWDDSVRRDVYAGIDNDAAASRWRFTGTSRISPDIIAGFLYEFSHTGARTSRVNQANGGDDPPGTGNVQELRQANAWVESRRLGRLTLGFASQATDGIAEIDLSRSEIVSGASVNSWMESFNSNFRITGVPGSFYYLPSVIFFQGNLDGGRDQLVRWDSPTLHGFRLSASHSLHSSAELDPDFPMWDVALRYAAEFNGIRYASGIGYQHGNIRDSSGVNFTGAGAGPLAGAAVQFNWSVPAQTITGSSSMLHVPTGLFLTTASGQVTFEDTVFDGDKYRYFYVKAGRLANIIPHGQTSIYGEYYHLKYSAGPTPGGALGLDFSSSVWGVGIVQHIEAAAMEIYLAYRHYDAPDFNLAGIGRIEFGDFDMVQAGMRLRF